MLTRIEIDGFKSFEGFELDLGPFAVVLGPNAAGKSNLFDAIQLLSRLVADDLRTGLQGLRGDVHELFRQSATGVPEPAMTFAVEVLVDPRVRDPWGAEHKLSHTRIRYELTVERRTHRQGIERLLVTRERAVPILKKEDRWRLSGRRLSAAYSKSAGRQTPWLDTREEKGKKSFKIHHQDGKAGWTRPAEAAEATVLSSMRTAEFPHLFALREEMRSWRLLQLDPASLRRPSPKMGPDVLLPDGSNLAAVLARIKTESEDEDAPGGVLADIGSDLTSIIPGVLGVDVEEDEGAREYRARVRLRDRIQFPTRVISDGTLRVLALLTALHDPRHRGLLCFEEPENGIHPARLRTLMERLRELVSNPTAQEVVSEPEPLTQMIMSSHSPVVLSALDSADPEGRTPSQVLFADIVALTDPKTRSVRRRTRIRSVARRDERELFPPDATPVSRFEVKKYLDTVDHEA